MQLGCGLQAAGMLKQELFVCCGGRRKRSHGQQRQRASVTGRRRTVQPGLWASGCGRVKAGERAAGADGRCSWEPQGLRLLLLHALSRCHFLTGRGTFFEASIPDCSFNALAAAHASPAAAALLARAQCVVRPLGIPVHLNQIYANEVSLSAKYGLCRKGDCGDPFNFKSGSNKLTSERRGSSLFCSDFRLA